MFHDIEQFINDINSIDDLDYGDFMRRANLYLNHLNENLRPFNQDIKKKLSEMQYYLQFVSNWDVESTRKRIIKDATYIDELLAAHKQDWESVPNMI